MTRRGIFARLIAVLLPVAGAFFSPAAADDGTLRVPLEVNLGRELEAVTRIAYEEALELRVDLAVANDSDRPWSMLELSFEMYDFTREAFVPITARDVTAFGRASLPLAAWREIFEVRINGVYAGGPGGNWDVEFGDAPKSMTIRFIELLVQPRDRISIRFPVSRTPSLWRLRAIAIPLGLGLADKYLRPLFTSYIPKNLDQERPATIYRIQPLKNAR